jgi:hypothetical protein
MSDLLYAAFAVLLIVIIWRSPNFPDDMSPA